MTRKHWAAVLVATVLVVTGCGGGGDDTETSEPDETETTSEPASTTDATSTGGGDDQEAASVALDFGVWTYDLDTVNGLLEQFRDYSLNTAEPPIDTQIQISEAGFGEFDTHVTQLNAAGNQLDVLYGSDHWLAKWANAGWVVPIEEHCPELMEQTDEVASFSMSGISHDGQVYGLPYYSDVMYFVYNERMLSEAGFDQPPTTWQEVTEQAVALEEQGIVDDPFTMGLTIDSWFEEQLYAMVYSMGGQFFDEELGASFDTAGGPVHDAIDWMRSAVQDDGIMQSGTLEMSIQDAALAFQQGDAAFAMVAGYMMRDLDNPEGSEVVDDWRVATMPGSTGETAGFTRSYLVGSGALEDDQTLQAACRFVAFHGGQVEHEGEAEYHVAKTWAVDNGLGFSVDSLWQDEEVRASFSELADVDLLQQQKTDARAKGGMSAPWFAEWISYVRPEVQRTLLGEQSTEDTLAAIKQQWQSLAEG